MTTLVPCSFFSLSDIVSSPRVNGYQAVLYPKCTSSHCRLVHCSSVCKSVSHTVFVSCLSSYPFTLLHHISSECTHILTHSFLSYPTAFSVVFIVAHTLCTLLIYYYSFRIPSGRLSSSRRPRSTARYRSFMMPIFNVCGSSNVSQ